MRMDNFLKAFQACVFISSCSQVSAKIVKDGLWTDNDFYKVDFETEYKVEDGIATFIEIEKNRLVQSATMTQVGDLEDIYSQKNVQLVSSQLSKQDWQYLFPKQTSGYDYDLFLHAVAQFPAFCGEFDNDLYSSGYACRRELATILAHMTYESGHYSKQIENFTVPTSNFDDGLRYKNECDLPASTQSQNQQCPKYHDTSTFMGNAFPAKEEQHYFGRGPLHMRFNGNYGRFSKAYFNDDFNGGKQLLNEPQELANDEAMGFSSLLWFYMTPHYPRPSAHDVVTGFFKPNTVDSILNVGNDFGTTIAIMAQDSPSGKTNECMRLLETKAAQTRANIYQELSQFFGLKKEGKLGCWLTLLTYSGSGDKPAYWDGGNVQNRCKLVNYETKFSIFNSEDYKRCVCAYWGDGEIDCKQEQIQKCQWDGLLSRTTQMHRHYVLQSDTELQVELRPVINKMNLSSCQLKNTQTGDAVTIPEDYIAIELITDNLGGRKSDEQFRIDNFNTNDAVLGSDAPTSLYIASAFDQSTIVYTQTDQISFKTRYDRLLHEGQWILGIRTCIDRRQEELGRLDCDTGTNFIQLTVIDCNDSDVSKLPQCQKQDPDPVDPDPVDPDPVDPDPVDPDPVIPDPVVPEPAETETEDIEPEPTPEPEEPEIDDQQNLIPYLVDFDPLKVYEVTQGQSLQIQLSDIDDDDEGDRVEIKIELSKEQERWIKFDEEYRVINANPGSSVPLGLSSVSLVLDDSKDQREYVLTLWVLPPAKPLEPEQPIKPIIVPDPEPEPSIEETDSESGEIEQNTEEVGTDFTPADGSKDDGNGFDPQTLWALDTLKDRVKQRQQQVLPFIESEQLEQQEQPKPPQSKIATVNEIGEVILVFSEEMFLEELFVGFEFTSETNSSSLLGGDDSDYRQRRLQTNDTQVDLSSIMKVELVQGSAENSAPLDQLSFETQLQDVDDTSISLKLVFQNPLSVSIGSKADLLRISFADSSVFVSRQTGLSLDQGLVLVKQIPKQFPSISSYELAVVAGSTVQAAANTAFLSQFSVTICLAVSLKAMWNLMHVMQVMAYLRLLVDWPANSQMMLQSMHNAITLENIINDFYTSFQTQFDQSSEQQQENDELQDKDVLSNNLALSLGIFGVCLGAIFCALLVYFLLKLLAVRLQCFKTVQRILKQKLFYNVWIRYMIESNLKMTHNCVFYLTISGGFDSFEDSFSTILRVTILVIIVIWPFFTTFFLIYRREELDEVGFRQKFISMYNGHKTSWAGTLTYTSVFCLRRMALVCSLLALQQDQYWLVLCFNGVQSLYFIYMTNVAPHTEAIHNGLEYFNELCLIAMQYIMVFFISGSQINPQVQWDIGTAVMFLVAFVFTVNVIALVYLSVNRLIYFYRVRKARQAFLRVRVRRNALRLSSKNLLSNEHNDARNLTQMIEEIEMEGEIYLPSMRALIKKQDPNQRDNQVKMHPKLPDLERPIQIQAQMRQVSSKVRAKGDAQLAKVMDQETQMSENGIELLSTKRSVGAKITGIGKEGVNANLSSDRGLLLIPNSSQRKEDCQLLQGKQGGDRERKTELQIEPEQDSANDYVEMVGTRRPLPVIPDCTNSIEQQSSSSASQTYLPLNRPHNKELKSSMPAKHQTSQRDQPSLDQQNRYQYSQPQGQAPSNQNKTQSLVATLQARIHQQPPANLKSNTAVNASELDDSITPRMSPGGRQEQVSLEFAKRTPSSNHAAHCQDHTMSAPNHATASGQEGAAGLEVQELGAHNLVAPILVSSSQQSKDINNNRVGESQINCVAVNGSVRVSGSVSGEQAAQRRKSVDSERGGSANQHSDSPQPLHQDQPHSGN